MRHPRHPAAPFQLTRPGRDAALRWGWTGAITALAVLACAALLDAGPSLGPVGAVSFLVAAGSLVPEPNVVAHVDRIGIHLGHGAAVPMLAWEQVRRIEVGAMGADHLLVVHGEDGPLCHITAQESPPATVLRLEAAKITGLVPGWVRLDVRTHLAIRGVADRAPTPRPDLAT